MPRVTAAHGATGCRRGRGRRATAPCWSTRTAGAQYLCGVYRAAALPAAAPPYERAARAADAAAAGAGCELAEVPALGDEARDVDTWADLRDLREG